MNWTKITDDFPVEGSVVCAKLQGKKHFILCQYKNDSFGLGDDDLRVIRWGYIVPPMQRDLERPIRNLESTSQAEDHISADFSGLRQRLA